MSLATVCLLVVSACATRPAPDFGGRWKSVNHYAESTQEIPLQHPYVFQASPMDATLKTMLGRWTRDSKMKLSYEHRSDFTLHRKVADIQTTDLQQAVSQLTAAYAEQRLSITVENNGIVVRDRVDTADKATGQPSSESR